MNNQMMMRRKPRCGEKVNETDQMRPEGSREGKYGDVHNWSD